MKRISSFFLVIVIVFLLPLNIYATESDNPAEILIFDEADLLTSTQEEQLRNISTTLKNISIVFWTSNEIMYNVETVTDDKYDYNATYKDGFLFYINMSTRDIYVNTSEDMIKAVPNYKIDNILDNTTHYASEGNYALYFQTTANQVIDCAESYDPTSDTYPPEDNIYQPNDNADAKPNIKSLLIPDFSTIISSFVVTGIVILILFKKHNKANKTHSVKTYVTGQLHINSKNNMFVRDSKRVLKDYYRPKSSSSGSGSRSSSTRTSSSGRSHSGSGRKF